MYLYRREFVEVYTNLKEKLHEEESYNKKYEEILNYITQIINEKDAENNELYFEKVKSYNEEIKVYII